MKPNDEISTSTAAALLGLTPRRLRQLADEGSITIHRRGFTTITSAVRGYADFLRAEERNGATAATQARAHTARAALVEAGTARRAAAFLPRAEAEEAVGAFAALAAQALREAKLDTTIAPEAERTFRIEVEAAAARVERAGERAIAALRSGDLTALERDHG